MSTLPTTALTGKFTVTGTSHPSQPDMIIARDHDRDDAEYVAQLMRESGYESTRIEEPPAIDPAELDLYFPQVEYSDEELEEMYQRHLAEGGDATELAPLPELRPICNRPRPVNWNLFARAVRVVQTSSNGRVKFLVVEDLLGKRYEAWALAYTIADVRIGTEGFIVPKPDVEDEWFFHRELPEPPVTFETPV